MTEPQAFRGLMAYLADDEMFWRMEFRAYFEENRFAREQKDYDLGRKIVKLMRERRNKIFGQVTGRQK